MGRPQEYYHRLDTLRTSHALEPVIYSTDALLTSDPEHLGATLYARQHDQEHWNWQRASENPHRPERFAITLSNTALTLSLDQRLHDGLFVSTSLVVDAWHPKLYERMGNRVSSEPNAYGDDAVEIFLPRFEAQLARFGLETFVKRNTSLAEAS